MNAAVIGASGFVGGELLRLLKDHPAFDEIAAVSRSRAGRPIEEAHPSLAGWEGSFAAMSPSEAARGRDVVFLCLEHGEAEGVIDDIVAAGPGIVCDLSADFRVRDRARHLRHYGPRRAAAADRFVYALADVYGRKLRDQTALAAPGCFATAAALALWPLSRLALARPAGAVRRDRLLRRRGEAQGHDAPPAASARSFRLCDARPPPRGGDRGAVAALDRPRREAAACGPRRTVRPRHLPHASRAVGTSGGGARQSSRRPTPDAASCACSNEPPHLARVLGTNRADLHVAADAASGEIQVSVAIDNLIKGAAGQAIQAVNLAAGLDEAAGLPVAGAYPC